MGGRQGEKWYRLRERGGVALLVIVAGGGVVGADPAAVGHLLPTAGLGFVGLLLLDLGGGGGGGGGSGSGGSGGHARGDTRDGVDAAAAHGTMVYVLRAELAIVLLF
jgi:hypothetical protein